MEKTKLGLSVAICAALVYVSALFGATPLIVCAGYVMIAEQSRVLKQHAIMALVFFSVMAILSVLIGSLNDVFRFLNIIVGWTDTDFRFGLPLNLDGLLRTAIEIVSNVGFVVLAFLAFNGKQLKVKLFEKYCVDKDAA